MQQWLAAVGWRQQASRGNVVAAPTRAKPLELSFAVFSRPSVLINAKELEPAAWWSLYGGHLPLLSKFAPMILAQAVAASAAERNWSIYGQIQTANKSRMAHATADKLVYCHEAFYLQHHFQSAGWKADVQRWESDEESGNDSGDEDGDETAVLCLTEKALQALMQ